MVLLLYRQKIFNQRCRWVNHRMILEAGAIG
jgi:hypothetical protein